MRPLLHQVPRPLVDRILSQIVPAPATRTYGSFAEPWIKRSICIQCRKQLGSSPSRIPPAIRNRPNAAYVNSRFFSSSKPWLEKVPKTLEQPRRESPAKEDVPSAPESTPKPTEKEDTIQRVPDDKLPSHREGQRWDLSKRLTAIMDDLLPKLAVVSQRVNNYTGTDYSGIEALRREIKEQEQLVKSRRLAVDTAKQALEAAHAQQASSQKEVVGLLERKHSWSATDLERYMSLIRSEHINDQAVNAAKESVATAEQALEEARTQLEKRERAQYHEEQIWSDTIRRNSTWVTFGLMGVNILLLLVSLAVLEPWRRRRLVREIRSALEEQKVASNVPLSAAAAAAAPAPAVEAEIDSVVEPAGVSLESLSKKDTTAEPTPSPEAEAAIAVQAQADDASPQAEAAVQEAALSEEPSPSTIPLPTHSEAIPDDTSPLPSRSETSPGVLEGYKHYFRDLFSDRSISVRKVDLTTAALEGAAAGAAIMGVLLVLLRPK